MDTSIRRTAILLALLLPIASAHGQATPWKIEMRQVRLPTPNADCGPIELVVRDASGQPPLTPDGKQVDWQDFDITLTQGAGPLKLTGNGRFLCATVPGATGVVTAKYPESTYLTGKGKGRTGKQLIPGVTANATLDVRSAGTPPAATVASTAPAAPATPSAPSPAPTTATAPPVSPTSTTPTTTATASPAPAPQPAPTAPAAPPAVTGITIAAGTSGPLVAWNAISGASYTVTRWKIDDPGCCSNMSPPSPALTVPRWQDTAPPKSGTYVYRVMAMTPMGLTYAEAQYSHIAATVATTATAAPTTTTSTPTMTTVMAEPTPSTGTMTPYSTTTSSRIAGTTATTAPTAPTSVPIEGVSTTTTSGQMSSTTQTTVQSLSCSVPVESITSVSGLVLTSTSGGVSLSWQKIPCPSMAYRRVTVAVKDGQTTQTASAIQPSVDAATGQLYTTDAPASAGLASANYRIDATLPDGRTVSSQWVTWTSPVQQAAASSSGRYRIVIKGVRVANNTIDNVMQTDGKFDEIYVAAHTSLYDVRNGSLQSHAMMQSRVHGDIGNGTVFPTRIRAGTASPEGGLRGNAKATPPVWDLVPSALNPAGSPAQGTSDRVPFVVWSGELRDGVDALLVAPSVWESDLDDRTFREYAAGAQRMSTEFFTALKVPELASQPLPTAFQTDIAMGVTTQPDTATLLGSLLTGAFFVGSTALSSNVDRPVGLTSVAAGVGQQLLFKDNFIVVTRAMAERALSTPPPSPGALPPSVIAITYTDTPYFPGLEGQYILYLEIQRDTTTTAPPPGQTTTTAAAGNTAQTSTSSVSTTQ